jgi:hypothetical protein
MNLRDSYAVKTKASVTPFKYMYPPLPLPSRAFGMGNDAAKIDFLFESHKEKCKK